jgi:hypothetical protein
MSRGIYRGKFRENGCGMSEYRGGNLADCIVIFRRNICG